MIHCVDTMMYAAKHSGKGKFRHRTASQSEVRNGAERRHASRMLCDRPVRVRAEEECERKITSGSIRDISTGGIGLRLDRRLPIQTVVAAEPMFSWGAKVLMAKVIRSEPDGDGWLHGCELAGMLSPEELELWLLREATEITGDDRVENLVPGRA